MEAASGLKFEDREVKAMVLEVSSRSGYGEIPMTLRASYPPDTKKATLIDELGHRLENQLFHNDEDDHKYLSLWIYDVWTTLYGLGRANPVEARYRHPGPCSSATPRIEPLF